MGTSLAEWKGIEKQYTFLYPNFGLQALFFLFPFFYLPISPLKRADNIINIPVAKHHGLSGVTLSMKNLMGLIGGRRDLLHQKLSESIVDLASFFKPELTILDAVRILKANGPQGSTLNDVERRDTIAASTDLVKIDAFGIDLFGDMFKERNLSGFPHLQLAEKKGLGSSDYRASGYVEIDLGQA